jgi:hypothetical protein
VIGGLRNPENLDSRLRGNDEIRVSWPRVGAIESRGFLAPGWLIIACAILLPGLSRAAEKFTTIYSARVMAQALPWIAEDAGLLKKKSRS